MHSCMSLSDEIVALVKREVVVAMGGDPAATTQPMEHKARGALAMFFKAGEDVPASLVEGVGARLSAMFAFRVDGLLETFATTVAARGGAAPKAGQVPHLVKELLGARIADTVHQMQQDRALTAKEEVQLAQAARESALRRAEFEVKAEKSLGSADAGLLQELLLPRGHADRARIGAAVDVPAWTAKVKDALAGPLAETVFGDVIPPNAQCGSWTEYAEGVRLVVDQLCRGLEGAEPALFPFVKATADVERRVRVRMCHRAVRSFWDFFCQARGEIGPCSFGIPCAADAVASAVLVPRVALAAGVAALECLLEEARGDGTRQALMGVSPQAPEVVAGAGGGLDASVHPAWTATQLHSMVAGAGDTAASWQRRFSDRLQATCTEWSVASVRGMQWSAMTAAWFSQLAPGAGAGAGKGGRKVIKRVERKVCPKCSKAGHAPSRCPEVKCHKCGKSGHMKAVCPEAKRDAGADAA